MFPDEGPVPEPSCNICWELFRRRRTRSSRKPFAQFFRTIQMHNSIQNESYEHATWDVRNIHPEWALYVGDGHAPVGQAGYSSECNLILSGCTKLNNGSGQLRRKHMHNSYNNDSKSRMTGWVPDNSSGSASGSAAGHVVPGQGNPAGSGPHRRCHLRSYLLA